MVRGGGRERERGRGEWMREGRETRERGGKGERE